ncbi:putative Ig domain-containing protein [Paraglaciecola arctica]|uniref:Fibronectin type-III domain-containing protein n=1 Tax=Paraglaciecola arctica BSs20135 TaxID=493475 RepID=K6Z2S5_9ALTE|nr:putative Ig domain-containing protein [Paraglaciecola arctica]GAC17760.1 hypothetical protein GARC_0779 [Paraglaciecola arctica BSs20135]
MKLTHFKAVIYLSLFFSAFQSYATTCDVDNDDDIDRLDINLIFQARGQSASGIDDPMDANSDGVINARDGRSCTLQCTLSRCAIVTPAPPAATLNLLILDAEGGVVPEAFATVVSSGETLSADDDNLIEISGLPASQTSTIRFSAPGYTNQVKNINLGPKGSTSDYRISLLKRQPAKRVLAENAQSLVGYDGAKVTFDGGAFVDKNGEPVSGQIDVYMSPVDVSRGSMRNAFPGSYAGIAEGETDAEILISFGATEYLFMQNGQELQLALGSTAIIELPVYATVLPDGETMAVGDEIPLWYLNESNGIWQQEGYGIVVASNLSTTGLALRGEVAHFSWWNADDIPGRTGTNNSTPSIFRVNVSVILDNDALNDETTFAIVTGQSRSVAQSATLQVDLNTTTQLLAPKGETCFEAQVYLVDDGSTELLGAAEPKCVTLNTSQDDFKLVELVIDPDVLFWGILTLPACSIVDQTFGPAGATAVKGRKPFSYYAVASPNLRLPFGLSINENNGVISGIPTETGTFRVGAIIKDGDDDSHLLEVGPIYINEPLLLVNDIPNEANLDEFYSTDIIEISGGCPPYRYKLAEGELPDGVILNRLTGQISGVPQAPAQGSFKLEVIDSVANRLESELVTIAFGTPALLAVEVDPLQPNVFWSSSVLALFTNLGGPIDDLTVANLPSWLSFNSVTKGLSGTPVQSGVVAFDIQASNAAGSSSITVTLSITGSILAPQNIVTTVIGQVLKVNWDSVNAATGYIVSVRDKLTGQLASETEVSQSTAWITGLEHNSNYEVTVVTVAGSAQSTASTATSVRVNENVPELTIEPANNYNIQYSPPVDFVYRPQTDELLIAGSGIVSIPLSDPSTYTYVVGDDDISSVSSLFLNKSQGISYSAFSSDAFRYRIYQQQTFAVAASLVKQLNTIVGWPTVAQSHNDNITLSYNSRINSEAILQVSSIAPDGSEIPRMSSDELVREDVDGDIFYRQELYQGREIAAFAGSSIVAVPVRTQDQNINIGQSLYLIDENQTDPLVAPDLFPLQNCSPSFDYIADKVVVGDIRDVYQSDKSGELLAFIKHDPTSIGGLMRLNINSKECSMLSGIDALGDVFGAGESFVLQNSLASEITILNEQYILLIEGVYGDYPKQNFTVWMIDRHNGNRSQLLQLLYEFAGTD